MNKVLLIVVIPLLGGNLVAQENPITPKAAHVRIIEGPAIELVREHLMVVRWRANNPGGSPVHYGIVHYGTDPADLRETAKSPIRLNPDHSSTIFRVRLDNLRSRTLYYYKVDSAGANGTSDQLVSPIEKFTTP